MATHIEANAGSRLRIAAWVFDYTELQSTPHKVYCPHIFRVNGLLP